MIHSYHNVNAGFAYGLFDPGTGQELGLSELERILPSSIARLELSKKLSIPIPKEVQEIYSTYRPTPLFRASSFERHIGTSCEIYVKDEGDSPSGNHKLNTAHLLTHLCKEEGIREIATETTGNWGIALALAGRDLGIETACFIDSDSNRERPDRKQKMETIGTRVEVVERDDTHRDLLSLTADAAIEYAKRSPTTTYLFGSVYGYFIIPQSIIGLEARRQLRAIDKYPDIVIGSCGGGANLLGTSAAFITDTIERRHEVTIVSAESDRCPILTQGQEGIYSVEQTGYFPAIHTYGLEETGDGEYIGGLGSPIVASAVAHYHKEGIITAETYTNEDAVKAAKLFHKSEGRRVALETSYQLASVIDIAETEHSKIILVNISSGVERTCGDSHE